MNLSRTPAPDREAVVSDDGWFVAEIYPHEPLLRKWLRTHFGSFLEIDDLVQETYLRLVRARSSGRITHPKAYLFTTARNAALDRLRRTQRAPVASLTDSGADGVLADHGAARPPYDDHELALLEEAMNALPERCRAVMILRKQQGLSHGEIAERLGISKHTVNAQITLGMMRCREFFRARGLLNS